MIHPAEWTGRETVCIFCAPFVVWHEQTEVHSKISRFTSVLEDRYGDGKLVLLTDDCTTGGGGTKLKR